MLKSSHLPALFDVFPPAQRVLGDDERVPRGRGKPAPDIYLVALGTINAAIRKEEAASGGGKREEVKPEECLVFEDSVPGVEAGRRAGMRVVWCPHPELLKEYKGRGKEVLAGLTGEHKDEQVETRLKDNGPAGKGSGKPGRIDDGWGQLLETLEGFPYHEYGMSVSEEVPLE